MSLVEGLNKKFEDGFHLEIPRWEIADQGVTALWGPSGSGKTTLFRILIGLESCPGLKWNFKGVDLARLSVPERRLGVVFQSLELFPHMTAERNILFAAECRKIPNADQRLKELATDLRMADYLKRPARVLSGGEAQRVALARALIAEPRFLFLDEPFSSLDNELKGEARQVVQQTLSKRAVPTLLITHDKEDLNVLADHVTKIRDGRLVD
jgi:sulfate transport system ATP-binding protein/putative spermidine/putrescine transport system ATP-binding protein